VFNASTSPPKEGYAVTETNVFELSSRPEEFHPQALPEPCMNLSIHTAPDVRPLP